MRLSHICTSCGTELGRLRAVREPHYGFPIVTCPTCATVAVRRPHPYRSLLSRYFRLEAALTMLILQAALCIGCLLFAFAAIDAMGWRYWQVSQQFVSYGFSYEIIPFAAANAIVLGIWSRSALAHWPASVPVLVAGGLMLAGMFWEPLIEPLFIDDLSRRQEYQERNWQLFFDRLPFFAGTLLVMAGAGLLGRPALALTTLCRRLRWRWRAARRRRLRP